MEKEYVLRKRPRLAAMVERTEGMEREGGKGRLSVSGARLRPISIVLDKVKGSDMNSLLDAHVQLTRKVKPKLRQ